LVVLGGEIAAVVYGWRLQFRGMYNLICTAVCLVLNIVILILARTPKSNSSWVEADHAKRRERMMKRLAAEEREEEERKKRKKNKKEKEKREEKAEKEEEKEREREERKE